MICLEMGASGADSPLAHVLPVVFQYLLRGLLHGFFLRLLRPIGLLLFNVLWLEKRNSEAIPVLFLSWTSLPAHPPTHQCPDVLKNISVVLRLGGTTVTLFVFFQSELGL